MTDYDIFAPENDVNLIRDEYVSKMLEVLEGNIKFEIQGLKEQNEFLTNENRQLRTLQYEILKKEKELEQKEKDLELEFYRGKLSEIFQPFIETLTGYAAVAQFIPYPKCKYCNEERELLYTAQNGKTVLRECECANSKRIYVPEIATLKEISFTKDYKSYEPKKWNTILSATFAIDGDTDRRYMKIDAYAIIKEFTKELTDSIENNHWYKYELIFTTKEECQKYCDYLNT